MNTFEISLFVTLYEYMVTTREIDRLEESYMHRGEASFQVSGSGHEGTVAIAPHLQSIDWLHCHYRDKALMLARGVPISMFFHTLFAKEASCSHGRQVAAFMGLPDLRILSMTVPVGNSALQSAGIASAIKHAGQGIVVCSFGDGAAQQGEVLEAIAHAVREELPVLFLVQNNRYAISTRTAEKTFFSYPGCLTPESFYGLPLQRINGRDVVNAYQKFGRIIAAMRTNRQPAIAIFDVERLCHHTSSDDQQSYRDADELRKAFETGDPICRLEHDLLQHDVDENRLAQIRSQAKQRVTEAARASYALPEPTPVLSARKTPVSVSAGVQEYTGTDSAPQYTMGEALREVLRARLQHDRRVSLFGEDIEDPKGDVFGVTKGLSTQFPEQVKNAPLSESTIVGVSIGKALAGERPVAFIQFSDFLPLAYNQIYTELGSMYWRTGGRWETPVIIMVTCGAYRPGLGPFHAESMESIMAYVPGVDVVMPSNAGDAAGLLNAVFDSGRPTVFFYPKNCLYDRQKTTSHDVSRHVVPIGKAKIVHPGNDLTVVGWGNIIMLCERVLEVMKREGISIELIDLRTLSPWDKETVVRSAEKTGRLLVIHEENRTCGLGGEILATVAEQAASPVTVKRLTRPDTYIPYHFASQLTILPSFQSIVEIIASMVEWEVTWQPAEPQNQDLLVIEAVGLSPSDESVTILEWHVQAGSVISEGEHIAEFETDKAVFDFESPVNGEILELLAPAGSTIQVGDPMMKVKLGDAAPTPSHIANQDAIPFFSRKHPQKAAPTAPSWVQARSHLPGPGQYVAGLSSIATAKGSRIVTNQELIHGFPGRDAQEIIALTGIQTRCWATEHESALSLAVKAVQAVFAKEDVTMREMDLIICSTGTPETTTPSMACLLLHHFTHQHDEEVLIQAYDINAACSGFLYALQAAYDVLRARPKAAILVVTTETLSQKLDKTDFVTAPLFGDAASATVLYGAKHSRSIKAKLYRPVLSAKGDGGQYLFVPTGNNGQYVSMNGQRVFVEAVRKMKLMLESACVEGGIGLSDLDLIVPHQANQRIIDAIQRHLKVSRERVYSRIQHIGNTSSSSIPLCLETLLEERVPGERVGLCAFGGGFTFGGAVLEIV